MNKVLISCSFSPQARGMIATAIAFSKSVGAQMHFCHVSQEEHEARQKITDMLTELGAVNPILIIRAGSPDHVIRKIAKEIKADLIIAGALEHEGTFVGIFGSVARRIARNAPCSVLLLTSFARLPKDGFKNIVVSIQYDWAAHAMCNLAAQLAQLWQANVHVVHTYEFSLRYLELEEIGDAKRIEHYEQECVAEEYLKLKNFVEQCQWNNVHLKCTCLRKDGSELTAYAAKVNADLVIMHAPKRIMFWERFFNPPAEVLLQDLPCSTLLYQDQA